ncbi:olfactory receptor 10AG1-like [Rhinoderma darwinii]|uniref:olfactory receptor 10AG1-like n=1 Tax=Rhinoderma darwinii TaxID=43563 RepID=UPI003F681D93
MDVERLILFIQEHPAIWDNRCEEYHNRTVKEDAWELVAQNLFGQEKLIQLISLALATAQELLISTLLMMQAARLRHCTAYAVLLEEAWSLTKPSLLEDNTDIRTGVHVVLTNNITSIILLGFPNLQNFTFLFFSLLVIIYCGNILGNLLIMTLYSVSRNLQSPMYFFITQLSLCDILLTTDIVPTLLHTIVYGGSSVSFFGCIFQFCIFAISESSECLLLSVMSYDRYMAICNPLRYNSIMNQNLCVSLVLVIGLMGFIVMLIYTISIYNLHFCGPHIIDHFYCDLEPLVQLSCSDTSIIHKEVLIIGSLFLMVPLIIIVMSYVYIVITILKIPSNTGRHKAFSTCSSHLIVVFLFYGTLITDYMFPAKGELLILSKVLSLIYTVLIPLLNPIIYTMRNKDFKEAFYKLKGDVQS